MVIIREQTDNPQVLNLKERTAAVTFPNTMLIYVHLPTQWDTLEVPRADVISILIATLP